ncbi:UNVERIFIED_CONTAM: hypothetical protein PYX00_011359 [Menopon gallinae]|uniref:Uncharacterized protein n=1 Tax=Menopon gallinae TaxID=328185 RepID=A0AAW2H7F6_9NEOP
MIQKDRKEDESSAEKRLAGLCIAGRGGQDGEHGTVEASTVHAHSVDVGWQPGHFEQPLQLDFEPDTFQKQAFYLISRGHSVFVTAHTSSGKTLVAEYAIALAHARGQRAIYTSPIKALSNQKYYEFRQKFADVGILTGDVQINTDAGCTIMTTEILRNMLYRSLLDPLVKYVIFDEVHYINDRERGVVWEECLIMLPEHVIIILLSATVSNRLEFARWVGRTKARVVYIIATERRSVPLEHYIYSEEKVYSLGGDLKLEMCPESTKKKYYSRRAADEFTNYFRRKRTSTRLSIVKLAAWVIEKNLFPSIFFCFSRQRCEKLATHLLNLDMTTPPEKEEIQSILQASLHVLGPRNQQLPQVKLVRELVVKGIGIHFSSLLHILKETVEILLSRNLIKILIATETFAMGINMPAKSCVFLSVTKIDGESFRYITSGEYTQMSGRAGRRGKDRRGVVVIAPSEPLRLSAVRDMTSEAVTPLRSQFRLSFSIILSGIRAGMRVEDLMRKSFGEDSVQRHACAFARKLETLRAAAQKMAPPSCERCADLHAYVESIRVVCCHNPALIADAGVVRKGLRAVLKNNSVGAVTGLQSGRVLVEGLPEKIMSSRYTNRPHNTLLSGGAAVEVPFHDIFVIMDGESPLLDYGFCDMNNVILNSKVVADEINELKQSLSEENLSMIDDYCNRVDFLVKNGYLDESGKIAMKGKVAAEIRTVHEVLVTEMVVNNEFGHYSGNEILSALATMIFSESVDAMLGGNLASIGSVLEKYHRSINEQLCSHSISPMRELNLPAMQCVHSWLCGSSLVDIAKMGVQEGAFVRLILRLDETCRELISVGNVIGNDSLVRLVESSMRLLKREDVILASLYH